MPPSLSPKWDHVIAQQIKVLDAHFRLFKCFITGREIFDHAALKRDEGNITSLGEYVGMGVWGHAPQENCRKMK